MDNQNNNLQELEELRRQVAEFKNRIEEQDVVNAKLLSEAMRGRVSWIKSYNIWICVLGIVMLPLIVPLLRMAGCSWGPVVLIAAGLLFDIVFTFWNVSGIRNKVFAANDVLTVRRRLLAFKKRSQIQMLIDVPLIIIWLAWMGFDTADKASGGGIVIGGLIGLAVAFFLYYREVRSLNEAVRQIDEFAGK